MGASLLLAHSAGSTRIPQRLKYKSARTQSNFLGIKTFLPSSPAQWVQVVMNNITVMFLSTNREVLILLNFEERLQFYGNDVFSTTYYLALCTCQGRTGTWHTN